MAKRRSQKNPRIGCFALFMAAFMLVLAIKLVSVQVLQRDEFVANAAGQQAKIVSLQPERGKMYDRNGSLLAFNVPAVTVVANADSIVDIHAVATRLSPLIGIPYETIVNKLRKSYGWVELARKQPPVMRDRIASLQLAHVGCRDDLMRRYPKGHIAGQVIGFTRSDGAGGNGLELARNDQLTGKPGTAILQQTGRARLFSHPHYPVRLPQNGDDLVLTLDFRYQRVAEQELQRTVEEYSAVGGSVVILEPSSGELLAICSAPNYDPNRYADYRDASWKLAAITDQFEPGSTFKPAMLSAMFDAGYKSEEDVVFCELGAWNVMGETIRDTKKYGDLSARNVLVYSSNIGMAKMAKGWDKRIMHDYARRFGFGQKSGLELVGEISGTLKHPKDWMPFSQLTFSFGHEIAVTPLQMCAMYATIANDGIYTSPRIIKEIVHDGKSVYFNATAERRRVITKETADLMRDILAEAVEKGTGINAAIDRVQICGKTGTAHVVQAGGYATDRYISSFGGFFPKDKPKITIFVMIKEPKGGYFGGAVAAPCFQRIAERIVDLEGANYFQQDPEQPFERSFAAMPNLVGLSKNDAVNILRKNGHNFRLYGDGAIIISQEPAPGDTIPDDDYIYLTTDFKQALSDSLASVPTVLDLPVRNALNLLAERHFKVEVEGSGTVVRQQPAPGDRVAIGEKIKIYCKAAI
ncbi:penicillin-binding protein [candidate division KSB1 bacterium]|nr:penicillin-binding protein [candidate division KSB1 bacterium]